MYTNTIDSVTYTITFKFIYDNRRMKRKETINKGTYFYPWQTTSAFIPSIIWH